MKLDTTVQKTVRMEMDLWLKLGTYAKDLELTTENDLLVYLIEEGLGAISEQEIDSYIESDRKDPGDITKEVHDEVIQQETIYGKTQKDDPPVEETKKEGTSTFDERAAFALGDDMDE